MEHNDDHTRTHVVLTKGTMVSHYRIVEKIGAGGMGEVYLVEDIELKRQVALKFLPPHLCQDEDCRARFKREAQAAAKLDHPNIVPVYEVGEHQGRPYFVMAHVEGPSLKEYASGNALSLEQILKLGKQICAGLQAAHEKGITHRDIKPSNILIDSYDRARIVDFGLASVVGADQLTKTGSTLGTIGYMSPEQIQLKPVDHRSDLFSFGVAFYEMIAARLPFKEDTEAATMNSVLHETPEPLSRYKSGISDELQGIVSKLLEKDPELRYQSAVEIISDLKRLAIEKKPGPAVELPKDWWNRYVVVGAVLVLLVVALVFKPWKFEISPDQVATAQEHRLAIMYFDNLADPDDTQKLGEIAANLLITDLSESEYVQVVSSQRLYDILKLLGREGQKQIDRQVATQVAKNANAKWMLLGSILKEKPNIVLTAQLVEVATGDAVASQRIEGKAAEDIFALVDKLTVELKNDLALPTAALEEPDRPVADVTTNSPEAYRYYLEGIEDFHKMYRKEAKVSFEKALEYDSTFTMVYFWLVDITSGGEQEQMKARMIQYSDKVSQKEKHYIKVMASDNNAEKIAELKKLLERYPKEKLGYDMLGDVYKAEGRPEEAIICHEKVLELDRLYKLAYNSLAYAYEKLGDLDRSIWAINKYIELAPDEANPYDTRADLYAYNGNLKQAIESYEKALEIKPDFLASNLKLGHMYLFDRDYDKAEDLYRKLCADSNPFQRTVGRMLLTYIPMHQGKLGETLEIIDDAFAASKIEKDRFAGADILFLKADVYAERNEPDSAVAAAERAIAMYFEANPDDWLYFRHMYIRLLARNKNVEQARREAAKYKKDITEHDPAVMWAYWYAMGNIEFAEGNYHEAAVHLEKAAQEVQYFSVHYMLAKSYLMAGRLSESVAGFEKTMKRYDASRAGACILAVKIYYYLGQAYEASGWTDKAIEQYETFLDIWKNADDGLAEIDEAKERLARLKSKS